MNKTVTNVYTAISLSALLLLVSGNAWGGMVMDLMDGLLSNIDRTSEVWIKPLQNVATWLLLSLATISLAWKFGLLALQQADFQEFVVELVRMILFVGFFMVLIKYADTWSKALIDGFIWSANYSSGTTQVTSMDFSPTSILVRGADIAERIRGTASGMFSNFLYYFQTFPIIILYGLIAAFVALVYCEIYVVTTAGILLLGFGGNQWTNDYAVRYITYCVSVGMKLFIILLIVGMGEQIIYKATLNPKLDLGVMQTTTEITLLLTIVTMMMWMLPNTVQGIINGSTIGSGSGAFGAVAGMAGGAAAGAGVAAMGTGKAAISGTTAVMEAAKLAQDQISTGKAGGRLAQSVSQLGQYAPPGFKAGALAATTAKNLGQAAATVAGDRARGQGGGKLLPEVAKAVHAARVQTGADAALRAASGSSAGPGASSAASGSSAGPGASSAASGSPAGSGASPAASGSSAGSGASPAASGSSASPGASSAASGSPAGSGASPETPPAPTAQARELPPLDAYEDYSERT